jgi:hypothetical protein
MTDPAGRRRSDGDLGSRRREPGLEFGDALLQLRAFRGSSAAPASAGQFSARDEVEARESGREHGLHVFSMSFAGEFSIALPMRAAISSNSGVQLADLRWRFGKHDESSKPACARLLATIASALWPTY